MPFARGVRGVSGEGAGGTAEADSIALTGSGGASIAATGASIGGAGTFDGIFLAGVLGVLLAPAAKMERPRYRDEYDEA